VVPCYNEETRLHLAAFRAALHSQDDLFLLFVNDGSTDGTDAVLRTFRAEHPARVDVLSLSTNSGKAEAVRQGVLQAIQRGAELVGYWDADLATPLSDVRTFRDLLRAKPHLVLVMGARVQLLGKDIQRQAARHYLGRIFATTASLLLGLRVYDTQCGAKLFRTSAEVSEVFSTPFTSKWFFDVEILARLIRRRRLLGGSEVAGVVYEWPLEHWADVPGSKVKSRDFARALFDLWRIGRANDLLRSRTSHVRPRGDLRPRP
jgi:hypothetical protein